MPTAVIGRFSPFKEKTLRGTLVYAYRKTMESLAAETWPSNPSTVSESTIEKLPEAVEPTHSVHG